MLYKHFFYWFVVRVRFYFKLEIIKYNMPNILRRFEGTNLNQLKSIDVDVTWKMVKFHIECCAVCGLSLC